MQSFIRCLAVAALAASVSPTMAADAGCTPLSALQKRIVEKSYEGVDALRRYIYITRGIHQLDMMDVVKSLEGDWYASARCAKQAADEAAAREAKTAQAPL